MVAGNHSMLDSQTVVTINLDQDTTIDLLANPASGSFIIAKKLTISCWNIVDHVELVEALPVGCDRDSFIDRQLLARELSTAMPDHDCCWS